MDIFEGCILNGLLSCVQIGVVLGMVVIPNQMEWSWFFPD
jgi:hypothetical protein